MHVDEASALGLNVSYELFDFDLMQGGAECLKNVLDEAEKRGFSGLNITYPSKQAVIPMLDELGPEARALHSVNTVLFRKGRRIGHNTDWWGFAESFRRDMSDAHTDDVVLVGAGGAGAAVGYAMLKLGARTLTVHDTDGSRTAALVSRLAELFPQRRVRVCHDLNTALANANGLVHATPTGMLKYPACRCPPSRCAPRSGWRKSSMCRWSPSCWTRHANKVAARSMAVAWPCSRAHAPSTCSSTLNPTYNACCDAFIRGSPPALHETTMKILVLHGINLNMFGKREPGVYGTATLAEIDSELLSLSKELGTELECFQTNSEAEICERIHRAVSEKELVALLINAGAWTHYSYGLRDALAMLKIPIVEVHMSNIHAREAFRAHSVIAPIARGQISGFGVDSYLLALRAAVSQVRRAAKA